MLTFSSCCLQGYTLTLLQIHPWQRVFSAERGPHYAQTGGCWRRPWMCIRELLKYSSLRRAEKLTKSLERPLFFIQRPRKIETGQKIWVRHGHLGGIFSIEPMIFLDTSPTHLCRIGSPLCTNVSGRAEIVGSLRNHFAQNGVLILHKPDSTSKDFAHNMFCFLLTRDLLKASHVCWGLGL